MAPSWRFSAASSRSPAESKSISSLRRYWYHSPSRRLDNFGNHKFKRKLQFEIADGAPLMEEST